MRRFPLLLLALLAVLISGTGLVAGGSPAVAEEPPSEFPPGFTDGHPVGSDEPAPPDAALRPSAATTSDGSVSTAATQQRYFGAEAFDAVRASVASTPRSCVVSNDGLTGLVMAPIFKESSAATTAASAPSPMTLSRYDEWNGIFAETSNQSANYGLYAFRNPYTSYLRAYWHPGIGIWQYDSAGLGAPFTAVERMHVGIMAGDVATRMAARYCAAAGQSEQDRRYEAWRDWGYPCTLCEGFFQEMMTASPRFSNIQRVDGITPLGGTVERTCSLAGNEGTMPCWYVDPSVGTIQGYTGWATYEPDGKGSPTVPPAPVSKPFYVLDRGATEERHWLRADTGYGIDISASRQIGKNARPRSTQPGSGLDWRDTSGLCDLTTGRGACAPVGAAGMVTAQLEIHGDYRPVSLDADGDGQGDIFWYRAGSASDVLWLATGPARFNDTTYAVNATYEHVLAGNLDGMHGDELIWYSPRGSVAHIWWSDGTGSFTSTSHALGTGRQPFLLDSDGDGREEVFWYGPGSVPDESWQWDGSSFVSTGYNLTRAYEPFVGDFDGNGRDDIFWYAPGPSPDAVWFHARAGGFTSVAQTVDGHHVPTVGDFDGGGPRDVLWYTPGPAPDAVWFGVPGGTFDRRGLTVTRPYAVAAVDLDGQGRDAIVWDAEDGGDSIWRYSSDRVLSSTPTDLPGSHIPIVGPFSTGGTDGVLWYAPGTAPDRLWYR